jgi:hypothetical protein
MSKTIAGTTTQFLYDGLNPVQELSASNAVNATLLNGLGVDERFARKDTAVSTYFNDALGSAVALVKSGGTTRYIYASFGATSAFGTSSSNSYQFTGCGTWKSVNLSNTRRLDIGRGCHQQTLSGPSAVPHFRPA